MIRRCIDILASALVLLVVSPLLLLIALAVMVDSPGGPLYLGRRAGKDGRRFNMWKFRTMRQGADRLGRITGCNDARVTRTGRILRRSKLDELPQFVNVLLGDMTLVGPRPEEPSIVELYTPAQRRVLAVKPGITGQAQLEAVCEEDIIPQGTPADTYYVQHLLDPKLRRDLEYLETRTAWSDARVILATAALLLRGLTARSDSPRVTARANHE